MESNCPPVKKAPARHGRGGAYFEVVNVVRDLVKVYEMGLDGSDRFSRPTRLMLLTRVLRDPETF
ncbi:hypothetical protein N7530_000967 [Penicillium desertorum]|uniref:Uncharacterized protein n=1 Tax=Penicillium desertorum TaxID=1303715 RepID=A0A9W9X9C0_9EURO|nr:hypothetical protein N7530_000967 [Penicillium desertorum]